MREVPVGCVLVLRRKVGSKCECGKAHRIVPAVDGVGDYDGCEDIILAVGSNRTNKSMNVRESTFGTAAQ